MSLITHINAWFERKRMGRHNKTLLKHQDIATVRYSSIKPPRVQGRSLTLFHRQRGWWFAMQIVFFAALAVWTVANYVHVLKSL